MSLPCQPGSPDYLIPWRPTCFVIPEEELVDELCWAALMYRSSLREDEVVGYDIDTLHTVRTEVTWLLLSIIHGGDATPCPITLT